MRQTAANLLVAEIRVRSLGRAPAHQENRDGLIAVAYRLQLPQIFGQSDFRSARHGEHEYLPMSNSFHWLLNRRLQGRVHVV